MKKDPRLLIGLAVIGMAVQPGMAQRDFSDVEIKTHHVGGNVYMLEGSGGNIGASVGEDGILLIDDQFAPLSEKIEAALEELSENKLKFVLNTHWHGDHTGGNPHFGQKAPIIAHENVRKRLAGRQDSGRGNEPAMDEAGLPVITFDSSLKVHFNGEPIHVIHLPHGHTDGDSVIYFPESNVVHMGDHLFNKRFPFIDLNSGGSVTGYIRNVEKVLERVPEDASLIPGHGPLGDVDDLRAFHEMLRETRSIVQERVAEGDSLEAIQEAGLPERWSSWSWGFISTERWIETLHESLTDEQK